MGKGGEVTPRDREAFEAWALREQPGRRVDWSFGVPRLYEGARALHNLYDQWSAWQAAVEAERARYEGVVRAALVVSSLAVQVGDKYKVPEDEFYALCCALAALDGAHE